MTLKGIYNIHGSDSLAFGVFSVSDGIPDYVLKEHFQDASGFLIDETRDTLHATSACQASDCRLGDALDIVPQHLAMPLGSALPKTLASFSASSHGSVAAVKPIASSLVSEQIATWCGNTTTTTTTFFSESKRGEVGTALE